MEAQKPPPKYTSPKGMWVTKLILRIFMLIFAITLVSVAGSLINSYIFSSVTFIIVAPAGFLSLGWNLAEGICIMARGGHRGIHPGANVGLDLILWLGLTGMCVSLALLGVGASIVSDSSSSILYRRDHLDYTDTFDDVTGVLSGIRTKGQALIGIGAVLDILHFTTFVIACYETNVRNRLIRQPTIVMVQNAPGPMQPGFYPHPGYGQPGYAQPNLPSQQHPVNEQQMYYPPMGAAAFNQPPQQAFYPPNAGETYQGQPPAPSSRPSAPLPPVYPKSSPISSMSELSSQKGNGGN